MSVKVSSNYPLVLRKLTGLAPALRPVVARAIKRGLLLTAGVTQKEYLSGPRPRRLGVVTTRLRNSISTETKDDGREIVGRIGTNVVYGAFHEFGFHGSQAVKSHSRIVGISGKIGGKQVTLTKLSALRGAIKDKGGKIVGYKRSIAQAMRGQAGITAATQQVKAHTRNVNYSGRPYLRPALQQMMPKIEQLILGDLQQAIARSQQKGIA